MNLAEPMARISKLISENIDIRDQKQQVDLSTRDVMELAKSLKIKVKDLRSKPLSKPRTVCRAVNCIEVATFRDIEMISYKSKCHYPFCRLKSVTPNLLGESSNTFSI